MFIANGADRPRNRALNMEFLLDILCHNTNPLCYTRFQIHEQQQKITSQECDKLHFVFTNKNQNRRMLDTASEPRLS
jgi:hypothetical protein